MAGVLELAQLGEDDRVAEMDVGRRRVNAELALAERQFEFEKQLLRILPGTRCHPGRSLTPEKVKERVARGATMKARRSLESQMGAVR